MENGSVLIKEVKSMLEDERAITTKSALRLSLGMQVVLYDSVEKQNTRIAENAKKLELLESKNIILWIEKHPKLVIGILTTIFILTTLIDTRVAIAKLLGVEL